MGGAPSSISQPVWREHLQIIHCWRHPLMFSLGHLKPLTRCKAGDSHSLKSSHFISFRCFKKNCSSGHSFPENWGRILVSSPCWLRTWLTWPFWCYVQFLTTSVAFHPYCQVEDFIVFFAAKNWFANLSRFPNPTSSCSSQAAHSEWIRKAVIRVSTMWQNRRDLFDIICTLHTRKTHAHFRTNVYKCCFCMTSHVCIYDYNYIKLDSDCWHRSVIDWVWCSDVLQPHGWVFQSRKVRVSWWDNGESSLIRRRCKPEAATHAPWQKENITWTNLSLVFHGFSKIRTAPS